MRAVHNGNKDKLVCPAPSVSPDNAISRTFDEDVSMNCTHEPPLTLLDQETGTMTMNLTALSQQTSANTTCFYSFFSRDPLDEHDIMYGPDLPLFPNSSIQLDTDHNTINVTCYDDTNNTLYLNTHQFIPPFKSPLKSSPSTPSIMVLFLESMSSLAFHGMMKHSKSVMEDMGFMFLDNFVKSGDNSFPNSMAFLTGWQLNKSMEEKTKEDHFDNQFWYLWDHFKRFKYVTGFLEDLPSMGVFNYGKTGFVNPPTDFYPHAFWSQMYPGDVFPFYTTNVSDFCFHHNGPKLPIFLQQIHEFVLRNHQHPYFLFASHVQITHDILNHFKLVDDDFAQFFQEIRPLLNNTIVVFAGDHGFRKGDFVATSVGRLQERMPLFSIFVHDSIHASFPHVRRMLKENRERLCTWFDIHRMMRQFADRSFTVPHSDQRPDSSDRPVNPARQVIPASRTCKHAGIPDIYCVCGNDVNIDLQTVESDDDIVFIKTFVANHLQRLPDDVDLTSITYHVPTDPEETRISMTVCHRSHMWFFGFSSEDCLHLMFTPP